MWCVGKLKQRMELSGCSQPMLITTLASNWLLQAVIECSCNESTVTVSGTRLVIGAHSITGVHMCCTHRDHPFRIITFVGYQHLIVKHYRMSVISFAQTIKKIVKDGKLRAHTNTKTNSFLGLTSSSPTSNLLVSLDFWRGHIIEIAKHERVLVRDLGVSLCR